MSNKINKHSDLCNAHALQLFVKNESGIFCGHDTSEQKSDFYYNWLNNGSLEPTYILFVIM